MNTKFLMVPLYELHFINSLEDVVFDEAVAEYFKNQNSLEERKEIYNCLGWVEEHPEFDYKNIARDLPVPDPIKFSNKEVYQYLIDFKKFMENKRYEMLTDDRAPKSY